MHTAIHAFIASTVLGAIAAPAAASPGCPTIEEVQVPPAALNKSTRSFAAHNFRDRFIRHSGFLGYLTPPVPREANDTTTRLDASFVLNAFGTCRPGNPCATLTASNYDTRFLRHNFNEIKLHEPDVGRPSRPVAHADGSFGGSNVASPREWWQISSELFRLDSSWEIVPGLAGEGISFRSVNYPHLFLRHRDFKLWLEGDNVRPQDFPRDATFCVQAPLSGWIYGPN